MRLVDQVKDAANQLRQGKIVALPTDTFVALSVDAMNVTATEGLHELKRRNRLPLPVFVSTLAMVSEVAMEITDEARVFAAAFWPGPLTMVLPAVPELPASTTMGSGNVGVRIPAHDVPLAVIGYFGRAITGTSANISGHTPMRNVSEVLTEFPSIAMGIDRLCGKYTTSSTVIDLSRGDAQVKVLRQGAISVEDLVEAAPGIQFI